MAIQPKPRTLEDFIKFALLPENADREFEFIHGELIEVSPGRTSNSEIRDILAFEVRLFCREHGIPVYTSGEAGAYRVMDDVFVPDFAYKTTSTSTDYPDPVPPLWAAEVISPTDKIGDIRNKRALYREARILLWEIYPEDQVVEVYAPGQPPRTVGIDGVLDGGDVLPGFSVAVKELFPEVKTN